MVSTADEFILDVRRAARLEQKPSVATDSQLIDPDTSARVLQRAAIWLTPKVVAAYDPAAFEAWSAELQEDLHRAVDAFRSIAGNVPSDESATATQFRKGLQAFHQLKSAVQKVVRTDWESAAKGLIEQVEGWADKFGWVARREEKKLNERRTPEFLFLAAYRIHGRDDRAGSGRRRLFGQLRCGQQCHSRPDPRAYSRPCDQRPSHPCGG